MIGQQGVGQGFQTRLAGQLAFGAALELEGHINVLQVLFGARRLHQCGQGRRPFTLLFNGALYDFAALLQFAQVSQARFEFAQLDVVQPIGGFFAVAGNKGYAGAAVEQRHRRLYLLWTYADFLRNLRNDVVHGEK